MRAVDDIAALLAVSPDRRLLVLRNSRRAFALVEGLAHRCFALRFSSVTDMLEVGSLAAEGAEELTARQVHGDPGELADLRAEALAVYGNALRVAGDVAGAGRALAEAAVQLASGTRLRRDLEALLLEVTASLLAGQREYAEAQRLLARAFVLRCKLGYLEGMGKVRIQQGIVFGYAGEPERAIEVLVKAVDLVHRDWDLARAAYQTLAWNLVECYRLDRARRILHWAQPMLAEGGDLFRLKLQWLEAKLAGCSPDPRDVAAACRHYEETRHAYLQRGLVQEAILVAVDLELLRAAGAERP